MKERQIDKILHLYCTYKTSPSSVFKQGGLQSSDFCKTESVSPHQHNQVLCLPYKIC